MGDRDLIGALVGGKFRVERALGQGGMGSVYVAVQEPLGRQVALKVIAGAVTKPEHRERFLHEACVVAQLKCPHVVTLHDFGEHEGEPYIVMELLDGETLRARIAQGPVSLEQALLIARDLGCALRTAHEAGIVHRDVKPENVVLVPDRDHGARAKLLDFGIAKLRAHSEVGGATELGFVVGTPGYIAPEQILFGRGDDPAADLYALGVVLFEMLTGSPPFLGTTPQALMMAHARSPLPRLPRDVPADVAALVIRLLAKDPAERPSDGAALVCALDELRARANSVVVSAALSPTERVELPLPLPDRPSIAVQPLQAIGGKDDELFAEGISEDILTALSCFKQLFVVGLSSMWERGGRDTDALQVSRSMGARFVLQGSVRRAGERVRINAKLVDGVSGVQVWAQRYDRELSDLFEVQDEVTQAIVSCVAGRVEQGHGEHARKKAPQALAAYDWLARGRALHHRRTREDNAEARVAVDHAIALDPDYAQAHAWRGCVIGQTRAMTGEYELYDPLVIRSVARALELDDNDAECHRLAAEVSAFVGVPDIDKAWHHHERAIALNPNDPRIVGQRGELALYRGELDEAARALEQAVRLDPLSAKPYQRHLICVRYMQRDLTEAARLHKLLADGRPDILELGAAIAALRGDDDQVRTTMERLVEVTGGRPVIRQPRPFVTEELRRAWREGFERAGIAP